MWGRWLFFTWEGRQISGPDFPPIYPKVHKINKQHTGAHTHAQIHTYTHTHTLSYLFSWFHQTCLQVKKKKKTIALADSIVLHSPPSSNMSPVWGIFICSKLKYQDFPGSPMVKTPNFHCRGLGFSSWWGNKIPHPMQYGHIYIYIYLCVSVETTKATKRRSYLFLCIYIYIPTHATL